MRRIVIVVFSSILFLLLISRLFFVIPFVPHLSYILGSEKPTTYILLLQNDTELRANGGFAGSYAKMTFDSRPKNPNVILAKAGIYINKKPHVSVDFQDIYVPNGQLEGYVTPPLPIQEAFQHGTWELANADWEPDFPTAATSIRWFFEKGGEINPDILATINLSTIKKILEIIGPFPVREYNAVITPQNLYAFLQSQAETDFFPGSTQKKDALTAVGLAFKNKLQSLNPIQYLKSARLLLYELNHGNLLLNSTNPDFQNFLEQKKWAGKLTPGSFDNYLLVETNLGANKANCCIDRLTEHYISKETETYRHRIHLSLTNTSSGHNPNPPFDFSGNYIAYLRFYIPLDAWNIAVIPNPSTISGTLSPTTIITPKYNLTEIGFFHTTSAGTTSTVDLSYNLATGSASHPYQLTLLKQNGLISSPQNVIYQGRSKSTPLTDTTSISF